MEMSGEAANLSPPRRARWGPWTTIGWGIGVVIVMMITQTIGATLYLVWFKLSYPDRALPIESIGTNGPLLTFAFLISTPFVLAYLLLPARLAHVSFADFYALKWPRGRDIAIGAVALAIVLMISGLAASASGQEMPEFMTQTFATARAAGMIPLFAFSFVVLPPVQEELMFRGLLYRGLAPAIGPAPTIALTAAVWSVIHLQYDWFFVGEIFALGLTLGWIRWKSDSTLLTMMLHATINGLALLQMAIGD